VTWSVNPIRPYATTQASRRVTGSHRRGMETTDASRLRADALGVAESVVMGIAGTGRAYSVTASTATLVGAVGVHRPASLLYCGLIMFGIVFAFRNLNDIAVNAGPPTPGSRQFSRQRLGFSPAGRCS
jgi:hypothetical protein